MEEASISDVRYAEIEKFVTSFIAIEDASSLFHEEGIHLESLNEQAGVTVERRPTHTLAAGSDGPWRWDGLDLMNDRTAYVSVTSLSRGTTLCMVLLKAPEWKIISAMTCQSGDCDASIADVVSEGAKPYMKANRAADGEAMAKVFHPVSRLTYARSDGTLSVHSQPEFCNMVSTRWSSDPYKAYSHLQEDPRVLASDKMMGGSMIGPRHGVIRLKVGFPPLLYTDILFFVKIDSQWWIVAKSSVNDSFLEDEAKKD